MAILIPKQKESSSGKYGSMVGTVLGGVAGAVAGGPAGAALGATAGGALGGISDSASKNDTGGAVQGAVRGATTLAGASSGGAMARRVGAVENISASEPVAPPMATSKTTMDLQEGYSALASLPPEQQQLYGPTISNAYQQALRRDFRGMA